MLVYMQMIDSDEEKMKFVNIYLAYSEMMHSSFTLQIELNNVMLQIFLIVKIG